MHTDFCDLQKPAALNNRLTSVIHTWKNWLFFLYSFSYFLWIIEEICIERTSKDVNINKILSLVIHLGYEGNAHYRKNCIIIFFAMIAFVSSSVYEPPIKFYQQFQNS